MLKQLSNFIEIIPISNFDVITDTSKLQYYTGEPNFKQTTEIDNGNAYVKQSDEREIITMSALEAKRLNDSHALIMLETTDGVRQVWGTFDNPVHITINYDVAGVKLSLIRKAISPIVF